MKRNGWLAVGLCMAALALPGCGGPSGPAAPSASAKPASPTSTRDIERAAREHDHRQSSGKDTDAVLSKEEGHPFWNVVGAGLGLVASVLVVAMVLGGF